jgi:hypothetical protein
VPRRSRKRSECFGKKIWRAVKRRMIGSYILRYCVLNWRVHRTLALVCIPATVGLNLCPRRVVRLRIGAWW